MSATPLARQLADLKARHPSPSGIERTGSAVTPLESPPAPAKAAKQANAGIVGGGRPAKSGKAGYINAANATRYRRHAWLAGHMHEMTLREMRCAVHLILLGGWAYKGSMTQLGAPCGMDRHHTRKVVLRLCALGLLQEHRTRGKRLTGYDFLVK